MACGPVGQIRVKSRPIFSTFLASGGTLAATRGQRAADAARFRMLLWVFLALGGLFLVQVLRRGTAKHGPTCLWGL